MRSTSFYFKKVERGLPEYEERVALLVENEEKDEIMVFGMRIKSDVNGEYWRIEALDGSFQIGPSSTFKVIQWAEIEDIS